MELCVSYDATQNPTIPPPHTQRSPLGLRDAHRVLCEVRNEYIYIYIYGGADKSLARPGMKQATATEDFDFHISYL